MNDTKVLSKWAKHMSCFQRHLMVPVGNSVRRATKVHIVDI